jgi:hypothetical protein
LLDEGGFGAESDSLVPTLKRGANNHCAYGADDVFVAEVEPVAVDGLGAGGGPGGDDGPGLDAGPPGKRKTLVSAFGD